MNGKNQAEPKKKQILLLEDDPIWVNLCGQLIEEAKFECIPIPSIVGFWRLFSPNFAAVIVDDEVYGGSFISDANGSNVVRIRSLAPGMPVGLNSIFSKRGLAERYQCADLKKDIDQIRSFLRDVQVRYVRQT